MDRFSNRFSDDSTIDREITDCNYFLHETMGEFNQPNTQSACKACNTRSNSLLRATFRKRNLSDSLEDR